MAHLYDGEAWKALDIFGGDFVSDERHIRIRLVIDGFSPFSTNAVVYSCWSIQYNLPPSLCMKYEFMFFCLIIPGPDHSGPCLNMILKPLIEELK
jgi:hypothetical protein